MNSLVEDQGGRNPSPLHIAALLQHQERGLRKEFEEREAIGYEQYSLGTGDSWYCFEPFPPQYLKAPKIKGLKLREKITYRE